jgi:Ca-activated chloride channel homolog
MIKRMHVSRHGSAMVLMTVLLPVVLAVAAYSINVVYMELSRTQLQVTTDVATRAAGRALAVTRSRSEAIAAADRVIQLNTFDNRNFDLSSAELKFGASTRIDTARYRFTEGATEPNAVRFETGSKLKVQTLFPTMGVPIDFRPVKSAICTQTELDVVLVIDRSGSMAYGCFEAATASCPPVNAPPGWCFGMPVPMGSRWLDAVGSVSRFLQLLDQSAHRERVGLVTFGDLAAKDAPLSEDYSTVFNGMSVHTLRFNGGATNIGAGILNGAAILGDKRFARGWASRVMVILTDGNWTSGIDPSTCASMAAAQNIEIYTVTFSAEADQLKMQEVAAIGNGKHFHATTPAELSEAFKAISNTLPTLITY